MSSPFAAGLPRIYVTVKVALASARRHTFGFNIVSTVCSRIRSGDTSDAAEGAVGLGNGAADRDRRWTEESGLVGGVHLLARCIPLAANCRRETTQSD